MIMSGISHTLSLYEGIDCQEKGAALERLACVGRGETASHRTIGEAHQTIWDVAPNSFLCTHLESRYAPDNDLPRTDDRQLPISSAFPTLFL